MKSVLPVKTPTIDVLIVSFSRDSEWFRHSTEVIEKNLTGYRQIIAVAPVQDKHLFDPIAAERKTVKMKYIKDWPGKGYFWQQWVKMNADSYSDADVIAHIDSDVFIKEPFDLKRDCFVAGKPSWLWSWYTDFPDGAVPWQAPTQKAYGGPVYREFMRSFPFLLLRSTYSIAREHLSAVNGGVTSETYISKAAGVKGSTGFSEFNFLGAVACEKQLHDYHWVDCNRQEVPAGFLKTRSFWSHTPIKDCLPAIKQMLSGGKEHLLEMTEWGFWVLSNDTHISKWARQHGRLDFDQENLRQQCSYIRPGDTVVDVGACIGDNTVAYAKATHGVDSGRVIAFEPNPIAYECTKRNLAGYCHVEVINAGLGDAAGQMAMSISQNVGASHLQAGEGVEIRTLDSMDLQRLNFMKIDAEGFEMRVLKGAAATIDRCRPVMFIEINQGALVRAGTSPQEVRTWLEDHGYSIYDWVEGSLQFDITCKPI